MRERFQSENDEEYEDAEDEDPEKVDLPEGVPLSQVLSNDFQGQLGVSRDNLPGSHPISQHTSLAVRPH